MLFTDKHLAQQLASDVKDHLSDEVVLRCSSGFKKTIKGRFTDSEFVDQFDLARSINGVTSFRVDCDEVNDVDRLKKCRLYVEKKSGNQWYQIKHVLRHSAYEFLLQLEKCDAPETGRNEQSISTKKLQEISLELGARLPDTPTIEIEPGRALDHDELPAAIIYMGEEDIIERADTQSDAVSLNADGTWQNSPCCHAAYKVHCNFTIEVIVAQCDGAYAQADRIKHMIRQIVLEQQGVYWAGSTPFRDDDQSSSTTFSRSSSFYFQYDINY